MGNEFRGFPGEAEAGGSFIMPGGYSIQRRRPVEGTVYLGGSEAFNVPRQPIPLRRVLGIKAPAPVGIGPA